MVDAIILPRTDPAKNMRQFYRLGPFRVMVFYPGLRVLRPIMGIHTDSALHCDSPHRGSHESPGDRLPVVEGFAQQNATLPSTQAQALMLHLPTPENKTQTCALFG
jgi:hypothetical protein